VAKVTLWVGFLLILSSTANAELIDRAGGLIYDPVLDITWLSDANLAAGSAYDNGTSSNDGIMTWANAVAWAGNLSYYDNIRGRIWDDWRLPSTAPVNGVSFNYGLSYDGSTDLGWNIISPHSELSYMFYVNLENKGLRDVLGNSQSGEGLIDDPNNPSDESLFLNLQSAYWSSTTYLGPDVGSFPFAWDFIMGGGTQSRAFQGGADHAAWAVRNGDVGLAQLMVPEATSLALWTISCLSIGWGASRRRNALASL
jgi:hypothetical protein